MKNILSYFGLSAVLGTLLFSNAWAEPQKISIGLLAVEIPMNVVNEFSPLKNSDKAGRLDTDKLFNSLESLIAEKEVTLVTRKKVFAEVGKKTLFTDYRDVLYMEKMGEDTFKLKRLTGKEGTGISFEVLSTLTKDGKINLEYKLTIRDIQERVPVKEAEGLDIGHPLLTDRESKSSVILDKNGHLQTGVTIFYNYKTVNGKQILNERMPVFMFIITTGK